MPIGRKKGSRNKSILTKRNLIIKKDISVIKLLDDEKEIKREIRKLRKLKRQCRPQTKERIDLHRQIKELKIKLTSLSIVDKDKEPIIKEILKVRPEYIELGMNLNKFSLEQLQYHLEKIRRKENG